MSRTQNTTRNVVVSLGGQLLNNLLRLVCRTAFIYILGKQYLGISSLYVNILTILSVSELGFTTAINYSLYKPLAENDIEKIKSLMDFFKRAYRVIGMVVLGLGLALMPFLPYLMKDVTDAINIYLYYLLFLAQAVVSYFFFAYRGTLLIADQKSYLTDIIVYVVAICMNATQIVVLFATRSFLVYTIVGLTSNVIQNLLIAVVTGRKYPYLREKAQRLSKEDRKSVFVQVYAAALNRISTIVGTATDNLIISSFISVLMVGLYDNYNMILQVIQKLLTGFFQAFTASVGNFFVTESREQSEFMFRAVHLLNRWLVIFCSVCFMTLLQPFVTLWIGETYLLTFPVVVLIVVNFATNYMNSAVMIYKEASGLFVRGKYRPVATAILNLVISILLAKWIGLPGIFLGSIISRLVTTWWYDAWLLFRVGFDKSPAGYYLQCGIMMGLIFGCSWVVMVATQSIGSIWGLLIVRLLLCTVLVNAVLLLLYGRTAEFKILKEKMVFMIEKKLKSKRGNA